MKPVCGMKQPIMNEEIYKEVSDLIKEAKNDGEMKIWRETTIEPQMNGYVKLRHGEQEYYHWHIEMLTTMVLTLIHGIDVCVSTD